MEIRINPTTAVGINSLKEKLDKIGESLVQEADKGNACEVFATLVLLEILAKKIKPSIKDWAITEQGLKEVPFLTIRKGIKRLKYDADPKYLELKLLLKKREEQIKQANKGLVIVDEDGEQVPVVPESFGDETLMFKAK